MNKLNAETLFVQLGGIDDLYLTEAQTIDLRVEKTEKRKRVAKYGVYGITGLMLLAGAAATIWKLRSNEGAQLEPQLHSS